MKLRDLGRNGLKIIQKRWREILAIISLILVILLTGAGFIRLVTGRWLDWTGFGTKTFWDLIQLLIIPAVLAGGAYLLNESARKEAALQTYLDKMTELLLDKKLRESEVESEVRAVARARTLTVLQRLDKDRKGALIQFLYEADLIYKENRVIDLSKADLSKANLFKANLPHANLSGVNLSEADLSGAYLRKADLTNANLSKADLSKASLFKADLSGVNLSEADLNGANLSEADLNGANLSEADLNGANLNGANLSVADLSKADLSKADLSEAIYTKNSKGIDDTMWPDGFDPDAAGAIRLTD